MGNKAASGAAPSKLNNGKPRVSSIGSGVLPVEISCIVGEYLSDDSSDYVIAALVGVQHFTLCLAQHSSSLLNEFWSLGLGSHERQRDLLDFKIDKQFSIADQEVCLHFLEKKNLNDCRVVIDVLIVKLYMDQFPSTNSLDDLRNTVKALQRHLKSVKHVVISINYRTCCIFSLKDVIDTATGACQSVDHSIALFDIIDDLQTCWEKKYLTEKHLLAFYFKSNVLPKSEKYLAKFVCSLNFYQIRKLFEKEASHIVSKKIMWVLKIGRDVDLRHTPDYTRLCHAVDWDGQRLRNVDANRVSEFSENVFCYRDNPFVERIVISSDIYGKAIQLPRPSTPLTDTISRSALIELTLEGDNNAIHLTDLNNGFFPQLRHLCIIGGVITGHLDSRHVPLLKTLILEPGSYFEKYRSKEAHPLMVKRARSLLRCGRPWQLVATQTNGGWSLASYDEPTANPREEVKEDSPISSASFHALPFIGELLLMGSTQKHIDEWQAQLRGFSSLKAVIDDRKDSLLDWKPGCVEKITVFCLGSRRSPQFELTEAIPEQERILTSLTCYNMKVEIDGVAMPRLQSLALISSPVKLSGAFPSLQKLEFYKTALLSRWQVNASLLQSLECYRVIDNHNLSLCPQWLPQLSSLQIALRDDEHSSCPEILDDESGLGFSRLTRVVFGKNIALSPFFNQCRVHEVSYLELTLNVLELPVCWHDRLWECETLTINLYAPMSEGLKSEEPPIEVRIPSLPRVKTLSVTEENCRVFLDKEIPNLTVCSLPSPESLTPMLRCPALKRIRFTKKLLESDKKRALDPATYGEIGARPGEIIFAADYQLHTMTWNMAPNKSNMLSSIKPMDEGD